MENFWIWKEFSIWEAILSSTVTATYELIKLHWSQFQFDAIQSVEQQQKFGPNC